MCWQECELLTGHFSVDFYNMQMLPCRPNKTATTSRDCSGRFLTPEITSVAFMQSDLYYCHIYVYIPGYNYKCV